MRKKHLRNLILAIIFIFYISPISSSKYFFFEICVEMPMIDLYAIAAS
jgi:hypothetical protein